MSKSTLTAFRINTDKIDRLSHYLQVGVRVSTFSPEIRRYRIRDLEGTPSGRRLLGGGAIIWSMSLAIDTDQVTAVLLADGWHDIEPGSFNTDAYEFMEGKQCILGGGQCEGVPSTGFRFTEDGLEICGPLSAVLAVKVDRKLKIRANER